MNIFNDTHFEIIMYKKRFKITEKEKEAYFEWYWLPEPELKGDQESMKRSVEIRLHKLRKQVEWTRKIAEKYHEGFLRCGKWQMNNATNEITIL